MDDKQPSDNHDFSDFDDLFAEQEDDFSLDSVGEKPIADAAVSSPDLPTEELPLSQPDVIIEDDEMDDLLDEPVTPSSAIEKDAEVEPELADEESFDDEWEDVVIDEDIADEDVGATETEASTVADTIEDASEPEDSDTMLDDNASVDDNSSAAPPSEHASAVEKEGDEATIDDELPDIDFSDEGDEDQEASQAVDEIIEELESFDDFIIDDEEEANVTPEFDAQTALEPEEQSAPVPSQSAAKRDESSNQRDNDDETHFADVDQRIIPEQADGTSDLSTPDNEEEEDESMKQSNMIALIAGAVALLASMGGLWLGYSAKAQISQMPTQVGGNSVLSDAKFKNIDKKMNQADEQVTKLATQLATLKAISGGGSDPKVEELDTRTARLEQLMSDLKEQIGHLRTAIATKQARPAPVRKVVHRKAKPRPTPKPKATVRHQGRWFVNLTSHSNARSAKQQVQQMKKLGITAESRQVVVKGRTYFRVRIAGFASKAKSVAFKSMLAKKYHITDSWVSNH